MSERGTNDRERWFRAPGRVNLIGDHTDYNEGFVLPVAIDLSCIVRATPNDDGVVRLRSESVDDEIELAADGGTDPVDVPEVWARYAAGVVGTLAERGRPAVGMDAVITSTIPLGAGLSSSAALEVALGLALCDVADFELPQIELALACQEAEQVATGVPCGIMDQLTSLAGRHNHALLIDCRSFEVEPIRLPPRLAVLIVYSGMSRALVDSAYAERRESCESMAALLGLTALRDATASRSPTSRGPARRLRERPPRRPRRWRRERRRARPLLNESHRSLRDDFEVSTPELDALAAALVEAGAVGARLTGGASAAASSGWRSATRPS